MVEFLTLDDVDIAGKRVLIREDFNVPIKNDVVQNTARLKAALPGIQKALNDSAQVILMSHKGRPEAGHWQQEHSLEPVAGWLQTMLKQPVKFSKEWPPHLHAADKLVLLENVRFVAGETENSPVVAKKLAELCDIFVMDAFASAHRTHASTVGIVEHVTDAVAGPLLTAEVVALEQIMKDPKKPLVAIIGGSKVSTKLPLLHTLIKKVDTLILGGGIANTLLASKGYSVGSSLFEFKLLSQGKELLDLAAQHKCKIILPVDIVTQHGELKSLYNIQANDQILDIGKETIGMCEEHINKAATLIWNGPIGLFEDPKFAAGTNQIIRAIAQSSAFSVAGGGETLAAIDALGLATKFSYLSTGGGAFLEYLQGKTLPAIVALIEKRK